jgi:hypothetical protein
MGLPRRRWTTAFRFLKPIDSVVYVPIHKRFWTEKGAQKDARHFCDFAFRTFGTVYSFKVYQLGEDPNAGFHDNI